MKKGLIITAGAILSLLVGCAEVQETPTYVPGKTQIFSTEADNTSGALGVISNGEYANITPSQGISSDAVTIVQNDEQYILDRTFSTVTKVSGGTPLYQERIENLANPHDLVVASDSKGYICFNSSDSLAIFNPSTGIVSGYISLSSVAHDSVTTNATKMQLVGTDLYIGCQMRSGYTPMENSLIIKVDTKTETISETISCTFKNVFDLDYYEGYLYVTNMGSWGGTDGAIEVIDITTNTVSTLISGVDAGSNLSSIAINGEGNELYATMYKVITYTPWVSETPLITYSLSDGVAMDTLEGITKATTPVFDSAKRKLYFGDATETPSMVIYDPIIDSISHFSTTLKPSSVSFITEMIEE
jgi:hypothetical protein